MFFLLSQRQQVLSRLGLFLRGEGEPNNPWEARCLSPIN